MELTKEEFEKLYEKIIGDTEGMPEFNEDIAEGANAALGTLTDRERDIISRHVFDGESLASIGETYHVGRQRISEIEQRAYRRLRHPSRWGYICKGMHATEKERYEQMLFPCPFCGGKASIIEDDKDMYHVQCACGVTAGYIGYGETMAEAKDSWNTRSSAFGNLHQEFKKFECKRAKEGADTYIEHIGLNMRLYNCLRREGITDLTTLAERLDENNEYLLGIYSMGARTRQEAKSKLEEFGLWKPEYKI